MQKPRWFYSLIQTLQNLLFSNNKDYKLSEACLSYGSVAGVQARKCRINDINSQHEFYRQRERECLEQHLDFGISACFYGKPNFYFYETEMLLDTYHVLMTKY